MIIQIHQGDCVEVLKGVSDCSIGAVVSDPPYGIEFKGREWDDLSTNLAMQEWHQGWLAECFRVLKPGGLIKAFSAGRTYHRLAMAMQSVGFTLVGIEAWGYGSGFPKGLDITRAIDSTLGVERNVVATGQRKGRCPQPMWWELESDVGQTWKITEATSPEAKRFAGYNTALKPSWEPFMVGRKP